MFMPSKEVFEKICENKEKFAYVYHVFPKNISDRNLEKLIGSSAMD